MELEMQKWYLPVKKKITWPIQKIIQKKKMKEETQKIKEEIKNQMVSVPMTFLTSRIEEAKINIAVEESFRHFQPYVQNKQTKKVVYNEFSNEYVSNFFSDGLHEDLIHDVWYEKEYLYGTIDFIADAFDPTRLKEDEIYTWMKLIAEEYC